MILIYKDDDDHNNDEDDDDDDDNDNDNVSPWNVHLHVESKKPVADLLLCPHLHWVVCPADRNDDYYDYLGMYISMLRASITMMMTT